jgi:hypothetical protein
MKRKTFDESKFSLMVQTLIKKAFAKHPHLDQSKQLSFGIQP